MRDEISISYPEIPVIPEDTQRLFEETKEFAEIMMMYSCAIKEIKTKFDILNDDMNVRHNRNPIETIKARIKRPESIAEKLKKKGLDITLYNTMENIYDVAGVRVICSFIDDIYEIAGIFAGQDDLKIVEIKDYIKFPKENGYRSYHMIVAVPVFFADCKREMKVEIQLRTIAMDFWGSLEHQMKYKRQVEDAGEIMRALKECSDTIAQTDYQMMQIRDKIEKSTDVGR